MYPVLITLPQLAWMTWPVCVAVAILFAGAGFVITGIRKKTFSLSQWNANDLQTVGSFALAGFALGAVLKYGPRIHTYGVMVALGFVAAIVWVSYESKRLHQDPARAVDLVFWTIVSGIMGAHILHVAVSEPGKILEDPLILLKFWTGVVFYGGLVASLVTGYAYFLYYKLPKAVFFDIFAPAVAVGHAVGRIGCLMAGCCYGRALDHPAWYGMVFPDIPDGIAPKGIALYPTQAMEVVGELIVFLILLYVRRIKRFDGQVMATYLVFYGILRMLNEHFRGDVVRGFLIEPWLSTSTFISLLLMGLGVFLYVRGWKKPTTEPI